jgi:DNA-binding FadR family transcriptional regulator
MTMDDDDDRSAEDPGAPAAPRGQHSRALDELGSAICGGELAPGHALTLGAIENRYGVSRSVARETVRVLEALRLVASRRRIGVVVLPTSRWNLFDPQVIRWRLRSADRLGQLESLVELRAAVESDAARLAAARATPAQAGELLDVGGRLWAAGRRGDREEFLALDVRFHALVLESSRNPMFARLDSLIGEVLVSRTEHGLVPERPDLRALELHLELADAVHRRDADAAQAAMRSILAATAAEIHDLAGPGT